MIKSGNEKSKLKVSGTFNEKRSGNEALAKSQHPLKQSS